MFDEPNEAPGEKAVDPVARAKEKADEARMHAELAAVFEGPRKFDAQIIGGLDANLAREIQRGIGRLEKSRTGESGVLPESAAADARRMLDLPVEKDLSTQDYHIHRRPGEVMIVRWIEGEQAETFYERLQAHFEAAMEGHREDERQAAEWKQDPRTIAYLEALDAIKVDMAERYRRELIRKQNVYVLSTVAADEMNIAYLADYIMGAAVEEIVGESSAPPDDPTEQDLAWFFKFYSLRGMSGGVEKMCFFAYLQKTEEGGW